jgi:3-oxoacid CoA-transferase B subunit
MDNRHFIAKKVASFFKDGDVINLGVGIPVLVGDYITDNVVIQSENGLLGSAKSYKEFDPESHYFNASGNTVDLIPGASVFDVCTSFGMIRQGLVKATVLGAFEVSQYGDLANWARPGSYPGMGGAMDLVSGIRDVIVAIEHCAKDGSPKIVEQCTLPLTGFKVVDAIVTELAVFEVSAETGLTLVERRDGVTVDEIRAKTGAPFRVSEELKIM